MSDTIELTERQRERLDAIKAECKEADPGLPEPSDELMFSSLLDTWDAIGNGHYHGSNTGSDTYDDVEEYDLWLTPHDMDHLEDGAPVFRGVGEHIALVLRAADWDTIERLSESGATGEEQ